ncbi:MAG: efflux RND transporter periplasmic adaptor subunit [Elainellaceae cyanobacterium]
MRRLSRSAVLLVVGVVSILSYSAWQRRSAPTVQVTSRVAEQGSIEETIRESGIIQMANQQTVESPVDGTVDQVMVQTGEPVIVGESLMRLLSVGQAGVISSQQRRIIRQEDGLRLSQSRVAEAERQLAVYQSALDEYQDESIDFFSDSEVEEGVPYGEISELEENISQTELALEENRATAAAAQQELDRLRAEGSTLEPQVQETVINAPITGQVIDISVSTGSAVKPRAALVTLADPSQELVSLELSASDAARITLGQEARVVASESETFQGRVVQISDSARSAGSESTVLSGSGADGTVPVLVRLNQPSEFLVSGSETTVEFIMDFQENATLLDVEALQRGDEGETFVWVMDSKQQAQPRPVQVGLEEEDHVEIEAGLRPGETVILPATERPLTPGVPVVLKSNRL